MSIPATSEPASTDAVLRPCPPSCVRARRFAPSTLVAVSSAMALAGLGSGPAQALDLVGDEGLITETIAAKERRAR